MCVFLVGLLENDSGDVGIAMAFYNFPHQIRVFIAGFNAECVHCSFIQIVARLPAVQNGIIRRWNKCIAVQLKQYIIMYAIVRINRNHTGYKLCVFVTARATIYHSRFKKMATAYHESCH
jgi:hypothetical protein